MSLTSVPASTTDTTNNQQLNTNGEEMSSSALQEELNRARVDAKETLLALLQFAEGVRLITRHMQSAPASDEDEECKSESDDSGNDENASLLIERMVSQTRLQGTVFGTDLLRLWDAAHHVRDYARLVTEESTLSSNDLIEAQQTAKQALHRAKKAEALALNLHRQNVELRRQVHQLDKQKRRLVQEVKTQRQQAASSRKMDMERLLQQHVAGAILLHEEQLKAMASAAAQQQQVQKQQQRHMAQNESDNEEEEKKEEEADMEVLVKKEECEEEGGFVGGVKKALASPRRNKETRRSIGILASLEDEVQQIKPPEAAASANKENNPASMTAADVKQSNNISTKEKASEPQSTPSTPSAYSPIRLFPSTGRVARTSPPPPFLESNKPSSSRSIASSQSCQTASTIEPPPEQPREHVGSKVFNFLFHPEKIAEKRVQEMKRQQLLERKRQQEQQTAREQPKPEVVAVKANPKANALLALDDLALADETKEDASVDATAPTLAATTPGSTCASASMMMRARSMSADKLADGDNPKRSTPKMAQSNSNNNTIPNNIIPNCVSFSDDTMSVQSNLPSPKCKPTHTTQDIDDDDDHQPPQDIELYKDFKMFQSLAIPGDDEIEEYHQQQSQALKQ